MENEKQITHISKFLSLILRHKPETIDLHLDENGWAFVDELIEKSNKNGTFLDRKLLDLIVETNAKKRFAFNESLDKIRASQGHSINIELDYKNQEPPHFLYHGTGEKYVESILKTGLEKKQRQHVHLSEDLETAIKVGQRHGKPYIFTIDSGQMFKDNFLFFKSDNGVWLADNVPTKYLNKNKVKIKRKNAFR